MHEATRAALAMFADPHLTDPPELDAETAAQVAAVAEEVRLDMVADIMSEPAGPIYRPIIGRKRPRSGLPRE